MRSVPEYQMKAFTQTCQALVPALLAGLSACSGVAPAPDGESSLARADQATLLFTASDLKTGYSGQPVGVGTLALSVASDARCSRAPVKYGPATQVSARQRIARVTIPANRMLIVDSLWSGADSLCSVTNVGFRPRAGAVYRLVNRQDELRGTCWLTLEMQQTRSRRFVQTQGLTPLPAACRAGVGATALTP
ncbi:MAG: hypothetical protein CMN28_00310 [Salinisphaeraceae bacterium]|jgi:hypothetical protein|nr:hypothetical protein [Salinisphaeraceae bacterium]